MESSSVTKNCLFCTRNSQGGNTENDWTRSTMETGLQCGLWWWIIVVGAVATHDRHWEASWQCGMALTLGLSLHVSRKYSRWKPQNTAANINIHLHIRKSVVVTTVALSHMPDSEMFPKAPLKSTIVWCNGNAHQSYSRFQQRSLWSSASTHWVPYAALVPLSLAL